MSKARTELLVRLNALRNSLAEPVVVDGAPSDRRRNEIAAMFRNGLAVLAFAITEAFIRDRTAEILRSFNPAVRFGDLSESLQRATTIEALRAVLFRGGFEEKADQVAWTLSQLPDIASAAINVTALSAYSFGQGKSNLSSDDVSSILQAFGINGGWQTISALAKRIGVGGVVDYSASFKSIALRRHKAAHDATANIPLNDLEDSTKEIVGICCSFDLLLSHAHSLHNLNQIPSKASGLVEGKHIQLRFISVHPTKSGKVREQTEVAGAVAPHTVAVHPTLASAGTAALATSKSKRQQLIYWDSKMLPEKWITW